MTNEQINIKIAELCDLFRIAPLKRTTRKGKDDPNGVVLWYCYEDHGGAKTYDRLPNYAADLNACHEFEELIGTQCREGDYWFYLRDVLGFPDAESDWDKFYFFQAVHATARQRCEAFLRVHGQWEEQP